MAAEREACIDCGGRGVLIAVDASGATSARACSCQQAARIARRLEAAKVPRRHAHCTLGNYESILPGAGDSDIGRGDSLLNAHFKVNAFVEEFPDKTQGRGLLLVGPAGRGKTHLAVAVLRALIEEKGVGGLFCDYGDLLKQIQNSYNPRSETTEYELLRPVFEAEVLVLDDLGSTKPTAWVWDTVAHLLNKRYNEQLTTLITTNFADRAPGAGKSLTEDTLGDRIGERMRSRLCEMCVTIELQGQDFRQTAGAARFPWAKWSSGIGASFETD